MTVARNDYGRQRESFEADAAIPVLGDDHVPLAFIRAPRIERVGRGVAVLATYEGHAVLVRQDSLLAATFHPEIVRDPRLHVYFAREIVGRAQTAARA